MPIRRARCWSSARGTPGAEALWDPAAVARLVGVARGAGRVGARRGRGSLAAGPRRGGGGTRVLLVCPPTVAAARRGRRLVGCVGGSGPDRRIGLVAASGPGGAELGTGALARAVGAEVVAEVPWDERDARQIGVGRWPGARRRGLGSALARLAEALA